MKDIDIRLEVETILKQHKRTDGIRGDRPHCIRCSLDWPCDTIRLAEFYDASLNEMLSHWLFKETP